MKRKFCFLIILTIVVISVLTACSSYGEETHTEETFDPQLPKNENEVTPVKEEPSPVLPITLSFAGDTMAAGHVSTYLEENGYQYPWEQAKPYLEESDIPMVNLETAVSLKGEATNKTYTFQSHPDLIKGMKWAGVDIVTVANNHSLDYGIEASGDCCIIFV